MLKFLTTTTALLAAAPALAAMSSPDEAREATIRIMQEDPAYFEQLKSELSTGLTPADLICADPAVCAPGDVMLTPGGVAVRLAEGGSIYPVSRDEVGQQVMLTQAEAPVEAEILPVEPAEEPLTPFEQAITPAVPEATRAEEEPLIDTLPAIDPEPVLDEVEDPVAEEPVAGPPLAPIDGYEKPMSAEPELTDVSPALEDPPLAEYRVPEDLAGPVRDLPAPDEQQDAAIEAGEQAAADAAEAAALERILTEQAAPDAAATTEPVISDEPEGRRAPTDEEIARAVEEQKFWEEEQETLPVDVVEPAPPIAEPVITEPALPEIAAPALPVETVPSAEVPVDPAPPAAVVEALAEQGVAEVETVTVSETDARSSAEDFGNRVSAQRDDSRLAENALFGLAGFAIGQALQDRSVVTLNSGDRVIITTPEGEQRVIKDQDALLVQPGYEVSTETYADGSTRRTVTRPDGSRVVTVRSADLRVLYRRVIEADGTQIVLIDQTAEPETVDVTRLPPPVAPIVVAPSTAEELRRALLTVAPVERVFSLDQVLTIHQVRDLAAPVAVPNITFATASAAIPPENARSLLDLGNVIRAMIAADPRELFLIEGHTDTVGNDAANLALSDRRAESVAKALVEYFDVPAENLIVQGYGERFLLVPQEGDIRENRRASVRRITDLVISR